MYVMQCYAGGLELIHVSEMGRGIFIYTHTHIYVHVVYVYMNNTDWYVTLTKYKKVRTVATIPRI